jgi:hypothetical protein
LPSFRICKTCKRKLPSSEFYSPPSGTRHNCKKCEYAYSRAYFRKHPDFRPRYERNYRRQNPRKRWASACLSGHKRRGHAIQLSYNELCEVALKTESCFICGKMLDWQLGNKGRMKDNSPTLDRVDNEIVIRADNIAIMCYKCNATKRDRTLKELLDYCRAVAARFHSHFEYPQLVHL